MKYSDNGDGHTFAQALLERRTTDASRIQELEGEINTLRQHMEAVDRLLQSEGIETGAAVYATPVLRRQERTLEILRILRESGEMRAREILEAGNFGTYSSSGMDKALYALEDRNEVTSRKDGSARYWKATECEG